MTNINYPLYRQRKALRENDVTVIVASWTLIKLLFDKHPSDITREQFERASEDLKVVSLALYARVETGSDFDGSLASEKFYTAYTRAVDLEKAGSSGSLCGRLNTLCGSGNP